MKAQATGRATDVDYDIELFEAISARVLALQILGVVKVSQVIQA